MKRSVLAFTGFSLTQIAIAAGAVALPLYAQAQAPRPNIAETMAPVPGRKSYAQDLVDRTVAANPELVELDLHATPPGEPKSIIVASRSKERLGKTSDADDIEVFRTGTPRVEINKSGNNNVEVGVPLQDVTGRTIGAVEMTFPYVAGTDEEALIAKAQKIGYELRRRISYGAEDLVAPAQFDPRTPTDTYAQYLVDDILVKQPGVVIVVLHIKDRTSADYPILGSTIGRIGKEADASDLEVIRTGKTRLAVSADGNRLEAKLPVKDRSGNTVGAVAIVFPSKGLGDQDALARQAEKIGSEMNTRIASLDSLYGAYPKGTPSQETQVEYNKQELGNASSLPMTKAVVSGAALEQSAQDGYSEAVKGVAGVSPANSKGSANDSINIRGIKLNLFSNYRINGGLPTAGVISTPTENKERLETLKGANALMFGVASPAGIINLVTKRAGDVDVATVGFAGTSFGQYGATVDVGHRFGAEKEIGVRLNASGVHLDNGVREMGGSGGFASAGLDFKFTDRLSAQVDLEHYWKHVPEQAGVSLLAVVNGVVPITPVPNPRNLLSGKWAVYTPHTTNQAWRADYIISDGWKVLGEYGRSDSDRSRFGVRIGGYNPTTGAGGIVTVNTTVQEYKNAFERMEFLGKFNTWFVKHDLTIGASKSERDSINLASNSVVLTQRQNIFDPIVLDAPVFTKAPTSLPVQSSTDWGVYGYDTISIGRKFKLLLGIRQTKDDEASGARRTITNVNTPAYGALYDVIPSLTVFASYMEGLEAGGVAPVTAVNFNEILPSAVSTQKEIGIRDSHIKGFSLNASYFEITRANAVTDPTTKIFANSGDINYKGFEATVSYEFLRRWTINAAGQWLKPVQKSPDATFNGFSPENTPKALGNISVQHRLAWVSGLTLSANASGIAKRFVNNQEQGTIPGYTLYGFGAGYVTRIMQRRVSFQFNVDNAANKRYWNSVQTGSYGTGMDRSFKLSAKIDF